MRKRLGWTRTVLCIGSLMLCQTSLAGEDAPPDPAWIHSATRTVDSGFIIYVESGTGADPQVSRQQAEGLALQDLANECTYVPKGTRIEERFDSQEGATNKSYVKIGVEFTLCDQAQKTTDPEKIRELADQPLMDELRAFQKQEGDPDPTQLPVTDYIVTGNRPINDISGYFYDRQQVTYVKQIIFFAPPATYVAGSPQYIHFNQWFLFRQQQQLAFVQNNPGWAAQPHYWSHYRGGFPAVWNRQLEQAHITPTVPVTRAAQEKMAFPPQEKAAAAPQTKVATPVGHQAQTRKAVQKKNASHNQRSAKAPSKKRKGRKKVAKH